MRSFEAGSGILGTKCFAQMGKIAGFVAIVLAAGVVAGPISAQDEGEYASHLPFDRVVRSAQRGSAFYQTYLGYMYESGQGVPQDYALAAAWYYRAAQQGDARAQYFLGMLYDKGKGVPLDYVEAHKWLNLSTSRSNSVDRDFVARIRNAIASKLSTTQIYEAQRRAREWYRVPER
jgi:TPR repeat protein